jgi:PAS domain S-box-containing protein
VRHDERQLLHLPVPRSAAQMRLALIALIATFSVGGYLVTNATVKDDRKAAATRHAEIEIVRLHALLDRARAYVVGLGNVLEDEPSASQRRFVELAGSTAGSAGLVDALWMQRAAGSGRLIARYTTRTRPALRPGTDASRWPALSAAIDDQATVFSASASQLSALGGEPGFYLVKSLSFGRGPRSNGYLAVFVPRGWLTLALEDNPREVEIRMDGRRLEGELHRRPSADADFDALARTWRVGVALAPASGVESLLPWLALAWPCAVALLALLVGNAIVRRRRAEREVESIVESSLDLIGIAGFDGYWKRVNPAFERTLGYTTQELLARPLFDFVHSDDVQRTQQALEALRQGAQGGHFVNRNVSKDREVHWLEWNARPAPEAGRLYASARDITDRRRAEEEVRRARARIVTAGDETRRRIERDLHDGTQQRLVSLALRLRATQAKIAPDMEEVRSELSDTARGLAAAVENLQEVARGIHPAVLSSRGLNMALRGLGRRAGLPVQLDVDVPHRLPDPVEVATYYVVSEALTNAAKHARASMVRVHVRAVDEAVDLAISDDGIGGAHPDHGSGLVGLTDRVEALGGSIEVDSPPGGGTTLRVTIPFDRNVTGPAPR